MYTMLQLQKIILKLVTFVLLKWSINRRKSAIFIFTEFSCITVNVDVAWYETLAWEKENMQALTNQVVVKELTANDIYLENFSHIKFTIFEHTLDDQTVIKSSVL